MQTILITGVTAGFGLVTAKMFHEMGYKVIGTGRRKDRLDSLAKELKNFTPLCFDIRDKAAVFKAFENLEVDILVNNAGLALGLEPAHEVQIEDWETMVDTNIKGTLYATRAVLPNMVKNKKGHIINLGSIAGTYPYPGGNVYGATKAFMKQFSLNLRADLSGKNIRVTNIEPGLAESEFSEIRFKGDKERAKQLYAKKNPLTPHDIAECIRWAALLPSHVNINRIEIMPTTQTPAAHTVYVEE